MTSCLTTCSRTITAFVALAEHMAATNDYTPQQASALYLTAGDTVDWLYGERGIFAFTFEMYPAYSISAYPTARSIPRETGRNFPAVTYLTGMADNPAKSIGLGGDATAPQAASLRRSSRAARRSPSRRRRPTMPRSRSLPGR